MKNIVKISPNKEFMVIDLVKEYAGATAFVGTEHFAVVTDLSEEDLTSAFSQELEPYKPYVIISREMYRAMQETHRNDNRVLPRYFRNRNGKTAYQLEGRSCSYLRIRSNSRVHLIKNDGITRLQGAQTV